MHLQSVSRMTNLFAATGHVHYAKCSRLYLQQMRELETQYPRVYSMFQDIYHTVRQRDKFLAGLWTKLIIEQVMPSLKSRGDVLRRRAINETVRSVWISSSHRCTCICEAMTNLS